MKSSLQRILLLVGLLLTASSATAWFFQSKVVHADITVVDEHGRPVPHVTLWASIQPKRLENSIDFSDLIRISSRFHESSDFVTRYNKPVDTLWVLPMTDQGGIDRVTIDYEERNGRGQKRPKEMRFGCVAIKRGYLPSDAEVVIHDESKIKIRIVLKRDPESVQEIPPYLAEFDRIRAILSDTERFTEISGAAGDRIEKIIADLESLAQQAVDAGDRPSAARIYARMQMLPSIRMVDGGAIGYSQFDPNNPRYAAYLKQAYLLDPMNPYIAARYLFAQGSSRFAQTGFSPYTASPDERREFRVFLDGIQALMQRSGPEIWPTYHAIYATWHAESDDPTERAAAMPLLESVFASEPRYGDRKEALDFLRQSMEKAALDARAVRR